MAVLAELPAWHGSGYELSEQKAHQLCAQLQMERGTIPGAQYLCYQFDASEVYADLGRKVEGEVFGHKFNNSSDLMMDEYGRYDQNGNSSFFVVVDQQSMMPASVLRAINPQAGLKTINDLLGPSDTQKIQISQEQKLEFSRFIDKSGDSPSRWLDIGTLAVGSDYRGNSSDFLASNLPYRRLYTKSLELKREQGLEGWIAVIDIRAYKGLKLLGIPFDRIIDGEIGYLGSEKSVVAYLNLDDIPNAMNARCEELLEKNTERSINLARTIKNLYSEVSYFDIFMK